MSHAALIITHSDIISTCLHWAVNGESGYDARSRAVLCRLAIRLDVKFGFNSVYQSIEPKNHKFKVK